MQPLMLHVFAPGDGGTCNLRKAWKRSAPDLDLEVFWGVGGDIGLAWFVTSGFAGSHPSVFLCGFLSSPSVWSQPLSTQL